MVKMMYQYFNLEYTPEFEQKMRSYLENNKQGKYGRHQYSLEEYGIEAEKLFEDYKEYMECYDFGILKKIERRTFFDLGV